MKNKAITETFLCVEYARVSTANEGQKDSCENQIKLCDEYVKTHPELRVVGKYVDDALTGGNDIRPEYQKLLARIKQGDIRYIIAKSTNRLCRSTEVDGQLQKICREHDVMIIFVSTNQVFNPFNGDDVTMHSIQMIFDQQYIYTQSKNGTIAHQQKCEKKILDATDVRYGYKWDKENKCMVVNEEQAQYVRKMFEWYVFGGLGVTEIARKLAELGVYGEKSGKILTANTISSRLSDSSYKGVFYINKKGSKLNIGVGAKKIRFDRPKEEWVAVSGPAIISEELFDLAQRVREERCHVYDKPSKESSQARFRGTHLFAGKVFCGDCGTQFHFRYSDRAKTIGEYKDCFGKMKKTLDAVCNNKEHNRIREDTLIALCQYSINVFLRNHGNCIDNIVAIVREASREALNDDTQIKAYQKRLQKLDKELKKNLEAWRDAPDPDMRDDFLKMYQENKAEKTAIEEHLVELQQQQLSFDELEQELQQIKDKIEAMKQIEEIDRSVVDNFIDRIIIGVDGKVTIILKFGTSFDAFMQNRVLLAYDGTGDIQEIPFYNLQFIQNLEDFKEGILYYQLGRCSDRA
ncbi:MAG: recombinase family protein [Lachnospiraceae bacterium]|nr:recombinase family protein [Lachnospiraceae bacterium]